ncbi:MAG TPA: class I SAM-dependent methyltransferase [Chitinophagaceae bacterium]|nr:class I SAM-dependent methyltransferase [Chitinophagaceae bacterium]
MDNKNVEEYYDDFIGYQVKAGVNDRIHGLFNRLLHLGLKADSNVLELGSGIGVMSFLLSKKVTSGKIEAVDISTKSIEFSRSRIKSKNISFFADDIINYVPKNKDFDFITLFDIIEHIPIERHSDLFRNLASIANENTKILINIPNPEYIEYIRENKPGALQIIDQPIPLSAVLTNAEKNGLQITCFETYNIWVESDYQFFVIKKKKKFTENKLSEGWNLSQKIKSRVRRKYMNLRYQYR